MDKTTTVVIIVLASLGAVFYFSKNNESALVNPKEDQSVVIDYTNSGYEPKTIRVKAGTVVNFVNHSDNPMWTASDPHPVHTMMQHFDAMRATMMGESYSFMFTEPGTWGYHNHMVPGHMGSVIVE